MNETTQPTGVRYHGLDALRAWAMSLGLVLHAAWIMYPGESGAPRTDASATVVMQYVCLAIHTFRMQLFFVLAGLFACLLIRKRGVGKFIKNRCMRIAVPLVSFWAVLCPIMVYQGRAARIQSGAIRGEATAAELTWKYFTTIQYDNVLLLHLWFLYYLGLIYLITLALRRVLHTVDPRQTLARSVSNGFSVLATSRMAIVILAVVLAVPMMWMKGPWGVQVNLASLVPKWAGLLSYLMYFLVGWLIYRNVDKLTLITARWRWQLSLGVLLTFACVLQARYASEHGYATVAYPFLTVEDFQFDNGVPKYGEFRKQLISGESGSVEAALFAALPEPHQAAIRRHENVTENQLAGILNTINVTVLPKTDWLASIEASTAPGLTTSSPVSDKFAVEQSTAGSVLENRRLIEATFPDVVYTEDVQRPHYYLYRAVYAFGYSLTTWCMIFGCIGFSQHHFDRQSAFWRYFSDASYWFYLAHLPIQFAILLWVGEYPWHWTIKFGVYVLGSLAVLLPSYHFLIRPSWIGWMLNGRMASVWGNRSQQASLSPSTACLIPHTSDDLVAQEPVPKDTTMC